MYSLNYLITVYGVQYSLYSVDTDVLCKSGGMVDGIDDG